MDSLDLHLLTSCDKNCNPWQSHQYIYQLPHQNQECCSGLLQLEEFASCWPGEGLAVAAARTRVYGTQHQSSMNKAHRSRARSDPRSPPPKGRHSPRLSLTHPRCCLGYQGTSWNSPTECRRTTSRCPRLPHHSHRSRQRRIEGRWPAQRHSPRRCGCLRDRRREPGMRRAQPPTCRRLVRK